ncbi:DUF4105 domain-containing protein [Parabacteroides sp. AM08-6]|uniref:lipoprotein N-acyltransferase Lnb domain-containing protein n=1 Tax=Parabacteroides sp. AM08-6 TaxID=2292053 RepID=UPI000F00399D|nr:DUF4105 domain-containing protein [Parabacteroides sp. AM08-6]RHJ81522.1 DUF4105 domain-containing protein [Parabacteroides sp. AM08-6]
MKKSIFLFLLLFTLPALRAEIIRMSNNAQISLLTAGASEEAVFTVYGHTAIRVRDTVLIRDSLQKIDVVFNYGVFDFSKPNFIYRFAKGDTDYMLGVRDFRDFILEYAMRGSEVTEQVLNLDSIEKNKVWEALVINSLPQNRVYRYNFFFDNCATRPAAVFEKSTNGQIHYQPPYQEQTFRELINYAMRNKPWLIFGCDLALGSPTDRTATTREMMFLPTYLKEAFGTATIIGPDGSSRKLVASTHLLTEEIEEDDTATWGDFFSPLLCCWAFFFLVLAITFSEWRRKTYFRIVDCLLFFIAGIGGVVLFFLCFVSTHPSIWPNWSVVWLQPFDLVAVILFAVKKFRKAAYCYHFINFAALTLMLIGWHFIPQHLNPAFIPLVMSLWLRSGYGVYRKIWNIG